MESRLAGRLAQVALGLMLFIAGCAVGRQTGMEHTLMHVFAFTPLEGATEQDFADFRAATEKMAGQIPELRRVWFSRLLQPIPDGGGHPREYGVAMEFDNIEALQTYADNPAHREWEKVYEKVRVQGTTTLDIFGE
jgi:Stress responsive A/B Barrel Domain